ncbi:FG-GAP repeat protein, partial [bacterium]|nr:FG-GAP repeat protein [bacterium]
MVNGSTTQIHQLRIYNGGSDPDTIPDWLQSANWVNMFASGVGDVNGDGFADVLAMEGITPARLYFGGSPMDTIPDLLFEDYANSRSASAGDVNADGYNDIAMEMYLPDTSFTPVPVYLGGEEMDAVPDLYLLNEIGNWLNFAIEIRSGDFNGDGIDDLLTMGSTYFFGRAIMIYLGSPWFNPVPDAVIPGITPSFYGWGDEISIGDINGDGRDDILVSAADWGFFGMVELWTGPDDWIDFGAGAVQEELVHTPGRFKLDQNYPNPFNASTMIHIELGKIAEVSLAVYDISGKKVRELLSPQEMVPGGYNFTWQGRNSRGEPMPSGMYLLECRVDGFCDYKKMILLK